MIKYIKRAGICFFAISIICLMVVGCVSVSNVSSISRNVGILSSEKSNSTSGNLNSSDSDANYNVDSTTYEIPQAKKEFLLDCNTCESNAPCTCGRMAEIWGEANKCSQDENVLVKVQLKRDWIADSEHSFGTSEYFLENGAIVVSENAQILLDLNGKKIDRGLSKTELINHGAVIYMYGDLYLMDNHYNADEARRIYEGLKSANNLDNLQNVYRQAGYGIITGGSSDKNSNGGCLRLSGEYCKLYMYGGVLCNNYAYNAGTIFVNSTSTFNMYDGIIANNESSEYGGGVYSQIYFNFFGGLIVNNKAGTYGGGIYAGGYREVPMSFNMYGGLVEKNVSGNNGGGIYFNFGEFNMYGGCVNDNQADSHGSGIYIVSTIQSFENIHETYFNMYGGTITNNYGSGFGGGIALINGANGVIYDGEIKGNETVQHSSAILVNNRSELTLNGGIISNNVSNGAVEGNGHEGVVVVANTSMFTMNGGQIVNNTQKSELTDFAGGGVAVILNARCFLNGGIISGNKVESNTRNAIGAGVACDINAGLYIGGPIQIYDNMITGKVNAESDCYLLDTKIININGKLFNHNNTARIGIDLATDYSGDYFTNNYSLTNNTTFAFQYFFSNKYNQIASMVMANGIAEVKFIESTTVIPTSEWIWEGSESGRTTLPNATVMYTGEPYKITNSGGNFSQTGISGAYTEFLATNAGCYSFDTSTRKDGSPVFVFTILPKEVDVLWNNTNMVYNGGMQKPTAYIAEDSNCKVEVIGEQLNSGSGYVATATSLSNSNYKISSKTMNKLFNIEKAKLIKPYGSGSFEYNEQEHIFEPNGYNFITMNIEGNKQTEVGSYNAIVSIKDKSNYEWADGTYTNVNVPYAITLAPPITEDNSIYKFVYYDETDGTRKTYSQGGLTHGVNDSEVNGGKAIIGNIAPNTSVKTFIENLGFDVNHIQLFAGNKLVYDKANGYVLNDNNYDNGQELAVGTGWYINYTAVNDEVETIYLSVLGDITGDGKVNSADINYLRQVVNNNDFESLSAEQKLSALIINKGNIPTNTDAQILWEAICGRIDLNEFM